MSNDNIFSIIPGKSNATTDEPSLPEANYVVLCHNGDEFFANGFLVFTSHHVAIMKDTGKGATPALVVPLANVQAAEIVTDDEEDDAPF